MRIVKIFDTQRIRKLYLFVLIILSPCILCADDRLTYIKTKNSNVVKDGIKRERTERNIYLPNSRLWYVTHHLKRQTKVINKKYGDYFFGLQFGRKKGTNGGWSLWNFLSIDIRSENGKTLRPKRSFLPNNIFTYVNKGKSTVEFSWPMSEEKTSPSLEMKIISTPSHKDWLFFQITSPETYDINTVSLCCYPSNSNIPPERERIAVTRENTYNLHKHATDFKPTTNGIVLGSQFVQENDGCLAVFDHTLIKGIHINRSVQGITMRLHLLPKIKEFSFALGYFIDKPYQPTVTMFTGETEDVIYNYLKDMEWTFKPDLKALKVRFAEINTIISEIKAMELQPNKKLIAQLHALKNEFEIPDNQNNPNTYFTIKANLEQLKQKLFLQALSQLK